MGLAIGLFVLLTVAVVIVLITCLKLRRKGVQSQQKTTEDSHQSKEYMELSPPKPSAYTALSVNPAARQRNGNSDEYDEVISPASNAGQYEAMLANQPDDQGHIYSKI